MLDTKERIMQAALTEFACKGFQQATVRDICRRADVNVASVKYYFDSKVELYRQLFIRHLGEIRTVEGTQNDPTTIKAWRLELRLWIQEFLERSLSGTTAEYREFWQIIRHEISSPSECLEEVYDNYLQPKVTRLKRLLMQGLPPDTTEEQLNILVFQVLGCCQFYFLQRQLVSRLSGDEEFGQHNFEAISERIFRSVSGELCFHPPTSVSNKKSHK